MLTTAQPDATKSCPGSRPGVSRPVALPVKLEHHPVVLAEQAQRVSDIQLRIADRITAFAGSMKFVYLHVVLYRRDPEHDKSQEVKGTVWPMLGYALR